MGVRRTLSEKARSRISKAAKARYAAVRAELSPEEAERRLHRMEVRRAWLDRNPQQREAKLERARKRRERKRNLASNT
jgi:hypothetical protein